MCEQSNDERRPPPVRGMHVIAAWVLLASLMSGVSTAQTPSTSVTFVPYLWFTGISGDVGIRNRESSVNESFTQIVGEADSVIGLFGRLDARIGPVGFYVDAGWTKLVIDDVPFFRTTGTVTSELTDVDFALTYRFGRWPDAGSDSGVSVDGLLGGRYYHLYSALDLASGFSAAQSLGWIEGIVGAEAAIDFNPHWRVMLHGDVGGFGINSDLTWSASVYLAYRFPISSVRSSVFLGYKALSEDYTNTNGTGQFKWNTILHGPVIGMTFTF